MKSKREFPGRIFGPDLGPRGFSETPSPKQGESQAREEEGKKFSPYEMISDTYRTKIIAFFIIFGDQKERKGNRGQKARNILDARR